MKRIATFGVFDIIHTGHVKFLEECKTLVEDSELTVVIARDSTVLREQGRKPVIPEDKRRYIIQSLKSVDKTILGNEGIDKMNIVEKIKPDIIILGYDQDWDEQELERELKKRGLGIQIIRLEKYDDITSSLIKKRIKETL